MDNLRNDMRKALSRLLAATVLAEGATPEGKAELYAARENAARVLLLNRARAGRPWVTSAGAGSFLDRWRSLRAGLMMSRSAHPPVDQ